MRRIKFNLRPDIKIKLNKIKYRPEPWKVERTFLGSGNVSDAKILSDDVEDQNKMVVCVSGKLYLIDKPTNYNNKLSMVEIAQINRNLKQYGCNPEDIGR